MGAIRTGRSIGHDLKFPESRFREGYGYRQLSNTSTEWSGQNLDLDCGSRGPGPRVFLVFTRSIGLGAQRLDPLVPASNDEEAMRLPHTHLVLPIFPSLVFGYGQGRPAIFPSSTLPCLLHCVEINGPDYEHESEEPSFVSFPDAQRILLCSWDADRLAWPCAGTDCCLSLEVQSCYLHLPKDVLHASDAYNLLPIASMALPL